MKMKSRVDSCSRQIHKFFGSKEHKAKVRGFVIGQQLLQEAADYRYGSCAECNRYRHVSG